MTEQQVQVKVDDATLKGAYANAMQVTHSQEEFVLDFMNLFPPNGIITSRVIISPAHAKRIVSALEQNIKNYEQQFGAIPVNAQAPQRIGFTDTNN